MIEVNLTYDLVPNADINGYREWAKKSIETTAKAPGMTELRANRNILLSPQIRIASMWGSLEDWVRFKESEGWRSLEGALRGFATNFKVEIWGPSPLLAEPIRPAK
jgi:hypothetical protein